MELKEQREILKHLESPFEFIEGFHSDIRHKQGEEERQADLEEKKKRQLMNYELTPEMQ